MIQSMKGRSLAETATNDRKVRQARRLLDELLKGCLVKGFYGDVSVRARIMDGTIQYVDHSMEQKHT
jgi:hypothetical protein